jgi:2-alkyl-3-oxoalkanoate reductase
MMPGDGTNLVDTTHPRTAAHAHLLALERLRQGHHVGGRAYFVAQNEPRPLREITAHFLRAAGIRATWCTVPAQFVHGAATACEATLRLSGTTHTHALSRFLQAELVHPHWFSIAAARRDLWFAPPLAFDAGITELSRTAPGSDPAGRAGGRGTAAKATGREPREPARGEPEPPPVAS